MTWLCHAQDYWGNFVCFEHDGLKSSVIFQVFDQIVKVLAAEQFNDCFGDVVFEVLKYAVPTLFEFDTLDRSEASQELGGEWVDTAVHEDDDDFTKSLKVQQDRDCRWLLSSTPRRAGTNMQGQRSQNSTTKKFGNQPGSMEHMRMFDYFILKPLALHVCVCQSGGTRSSGTRRIASDSLL